MIRSFISASWNSYLCRIANGSKDVYFSEEYVKLYENAYNKAVCFIYEDGEKLMLFPFLERKFEYHGVEYKDFETAYGYGGPLYNTKELSFIQAAVRNLFFFLKGQNYIAGLVRFHTLLANYENFCIGSLIKDRKTIGMDLSLSEEDIWMHEIHTKNRNVIKKAEKNNLQFYADYDFIHLDEFVNLYNQTMDKLAVEDFYYFEDEYYEKLKRGIHNSFIGEVSINGKIISAAIFLYDNHFGHYHLSGSDKTMLSLSPNNFLLWNASLELKKRGVTIFHLGGGTTPAEDDSLFLFKSRFSNHTYDFYISTIVFNDCVYKEIVEDWEAKNPEKAQLYKHRVLKYKY